MTEKQVTKVGTYEEDNSVEMQTDIPFVVDTFYHQYYLRNGKEERENLYLLGGNFVHRINFKKRAWQTIGKGSDELLGR